MRLIDADALHTHKFLTPQVKAIGDRHNGKKREQIIEAYQKGWNDCIDAIVDNAPTVEDRTREVLSLQETIRRLTKERPQGKWIFDGCTTYCSECGYKPTLGGDNYCPNCGAKMTKDTKQ